MSAEFGAAPPADSAEVVARFDAIVAWARRHRSRLGYFAALYRGVTLRARNALDLGAFEQPQAAERLLVLFACRYFDALAGHLDGAPVTRSWQVAFDAARRWKPTVSQHLLLGINAHINLDLGVAAARTLDEYPLPRADFDRINDLLIQMVDEIEARLARIWPLLRLLDWLAGRLDEKLIGSALVQARADAWDFALALRAGGNNQGGLIEQRDHRVAEIGSHITSPGPVLGLALATVRMGELRGIVGIIDVLDVLDVEAAHARTEIEATSGGRPVS